MRGALSDALLENKTHSPHITSQFFVSLKRCEISVADERSLHLASTALHCLRWLP